MVEAKKIKEIENNKDIVSEYLFERGLSPKIMDNPRYESILWKLSNMIRKMNLSTNRVGLLSLLNSIISIDADGNLVMLEGEGPDNTIITSKYMYDSETEKLKRVRVESGEGGIPKVTTISVYNDDGIEEALGLQQLTAEGEYFSKTTRLENRIDVIKIERKWTRDGIDELLPDVYQQRIFWAALEDIFPNADDIDPFEIMHFNVLGTPDIYEDVPPVVQASLKDTEGRVIPFQEVKRQKIQSDYKINNKHYSRTNAFEKGLAKYLCVKDIELDDEQYIMYK